MKEISINHLIREMDADEVINYVRSIIGRTDSNYSNLIQECKKVYKQLTGKTFFIINKFISYEV